MMERIPNTPASRTKNFRSEVTHDHIVNAAFECIRDVGYAKTTMELVATRAGCTRGGVIYHFGSNKAPLILSVAAMLSNKLLDVRFPEMTPSMSLPERLTAAFERASQLYFGDEGLVLLDIWMGCRTDETMRQKLADLLASANEKVIERWVEEAGLPPLTMREDAYRTLFRAAMRGLMVERILHGHSASQDNAKDMLFEFGWQIYGDVRNM